MAKIINTSLAALALIAVASTAQAEPKRFDIEKAFEELQSKRK